MPEAVEMQSASPRFMAIARRWLPVRNCSTGAVRKTSADATLVDEGIPVACRVKTLVVVPLPPPRGDRQPVERFHYTPQHIQNGRARSASGTPDRLKKQCWRLNTVMPPQNHALYDLGSAVR
ncbi:hypothetical protein ACNKHR_03290 [Shigella flexneri]